MTSLPVAAFHRLAAVTRPQAAVAAAVAMAALSVPAIVVYPGATWRAILFCLVSGGLVPLALVVGHSPFRLLIGTFLALGFWAKFVAHFGVGAQLVEPLGVFSGTPQAWDTAIGMATAGLAGVGAGLLGLSRLGPGAHESRPVSPDGRGVRARLALMLLALSAVPAVALFVFNYWFAILRIGFVPEIALRSYVYAPIAFAVSWGILLWVLALGWWLVEQGRLRPTALMHIAALEGAAAALSMGSRAQMLLHVVAGGLALWHGLRWRGWRMPLRGWMDIVAVFVPLFAGTLLFVQLDRSVAFARALRVAPPVAAPAQSAGHGAALPTGPKGRKAATSIGPTPSGAGRSNTPTGPTGAGAPVGPDAAPAFADEKANRRLEAKGLNRSGLGPTNYGAAIQYLPLHLRRLVIVRWVGLDGVLAITSREKHLGLPLLGRALVESPAAGVDALFQSVAGARAIYPRSAKVVFMTIPGPVAFAAFSGSQLWCFLFVAVLVTGSALLEYGTTRLTANPAVGAVSGVALAYLVAQLNFPRTLLFFVIELILAVAMIAVVGRFLREPTTGGLARPHRAAG